MSTETNNQAEAPAVSGEGEEAAQVETIAIPKKDYEALNQTVGSLKRELKDLRKASEIAKETPQQNQKPEESALLQKLERISLRQAGIDHQDDIELARATAKKWGVDIDEVLMDEDFKVKLERQQTKRSNELATSNIRGGQGQSEAKNTAAYWMAKGVPPSRDQVPDRKIRAKITRAMMEKAGTNGKTFYND